MFTDLNGITFNSSDPKSLLIYDDNIMLNGLNAEGLRIWYTLQPGEGPFEGSGSNNKPTEFLQITELTGEFSIPADRAITLVPGQNAGVTATSAGNPQ